MPRSRSRARSSPFGGSSSRSNVPAPRPTSSVASPPNTQVQRGPGLFGQMASTAAGVAVGSTVVSGLEMCKTFLYFKFVLQDLKFQL